MCSQKSREMAQGYDSRAKSARSPNEREMLKGYARFYRELANQEEHAPEVPRQSNPLRRAQSAISSPELANPLR